MRTARTIAWVQLRVLLNSIRRERKGLNVLSAILLGLLAALLSLGLALGLGALAHTGAQGGKEKLLHTAFIAVFWTSAIFGVLTPIILSTGGCGLDTSSLRLFPLSKRKLFTLTWSSAFLSPDHFFHYPALLAVFTTGVLLPGREVLPSAVLFTLVVVVLVSWTQAIFHFVQGFLRGRRAKERLGLVALLILVCGGLAPALLDTRDTKLQNVDVPALDHGVRFVLATIELTPPNLAASSLMATRAGDHAAALPTTIGLLIWALLGVAAAYFSFTRFALREQQGVSSRSKATGNGRFANFDLTESLPFVAPQVLAVASKELRYLLRSLIGRFNLIMIALFAGFVSIAVIPLIDQGVLGLEPAELSFYGLLMYTALFSNNFVFNSMGWEGAGFQLYMLAPVRLRSVVLGKNLGIWVYCALLNAICILGWLALSEFPGLRTLVSGILLSMCVQVLFVTVGNFASFAFPVARNVSSMKSNPSQTAILISMATIVIIGALCMTAIIAPISIGMPALQPVFLAALLGLSALLYVVSLRFAVELLEDGREKIAAVLEGAS